MNAQKDKDGKFPAFAWPGGYPIYYLTIMCEALCPACANKNQEEVYLADINWEEPQLYCEACGCRIESAYAEEAPDVQR